MGIYLNPGNENFKETTKSNIYVDKTGMIRIMNQFMDSGNKYVPESVKFKGTQMALLPIK